MPLRRFRPQQPRGPVSLGFRLHVYWAMGLGHPAPVSECGSSWVLVSTRVPLFVGKLLRRGCRICGIVDLSGVPANHGHTRAPNLAHHSVPTVDVFPVYVGYLADNLRYARVLGAHPLAVDEQNRYPVLRAAVAGCYL